MGLSVIQRTPYLELEMYGPIGENFTGDAITPASVSAALRSAPDATAVKIHLNSPGGSVEDGAGIRAILQSDPRDVEITVEGVAASIATAVAAGADRVLMHADASWMIHEASVWAAGNAADLQSAAQMLDKTNTAMAEVYAKRTGKSVDQVRAWMADETWFTAAEAREAGFIDEVLPLLGRAQARAWDLSMYKRAPTAHARNLASQEKGSKTNAMNPEMLKKLGLPADATEAQILEKLDAVLKPAAPAQAAATPAQAAATPAQAAAAPAQAAATPVQAAITPEAVAQIVAQVLDARQAAQAVYAQPSVEHAHDRAVAQCVDRHISAGKIKPAMRAQAIAACGGTAAQLSACDALWSAAKPLVEVSAVGNTPVPVTQITAGAKGPITALTEAQRKMCRTAGIKPEEFIAEWNKQVNA